MGRLTIILSFIITVTGFEINLVNAQDIKIKRPLIIGTKLHYGFIIPHSKSIENLATTNPYGLEVNFNLLNHREKDWKQCNCYSKSGLAVSYFNFANPGVLGSAVSLLVYVEPFLTYKPKLFFTIRLGTGLAYITKVYNEDNNPKNLFFSTPFSFPLFVDLNMKFKVNPTLNLLVSGSYNHISNGGYKQPNKGMNFPTGTLGMEYLIRPVELLPHRKFQDSTARKFKVEINTLYTVKVQGKTDSLPEKTCFIFGLSARTYRKVSRFNALSLGAEWIADGYNRESISRDSLGLDYNRVAVTLGNDILVGRFAFVIQFGYYIYAPYKAMHDIYEKYDLQYHFTKNIYGGVFLKAHLQVAELMGVSLGMVF
jgi:hypothetical protein